MSRLQPPPIKDLKEMPYSFQKWYEQLRNFISSASGTIPWTTVSKTGSNLTDLVTRNHDNLQTISGGAASDYYHLKQTEHTSLVGLTTYTNADSPVTLTSTSNGYILCNCTSGAITINLPAATGRKRFHIKKIDSSVNAVTINRAGSDTIQGSASVSLATQYNSRTLYSDGSSIWYIEAST